MPSGENVCTYLRTLFLLEVLLIRGEECLYYHDQYDDQRAECIKAEKLKILGHHAELVNPVEEYRRKQCREVKHEAGIEDSPHSHKESHDHRKNKGSRYKRKSKEQGGEEIPEAKKIGGQYNQGYGSIAQGTHHGKGNGVYDGFVFSFGYDKKPENDKLTKFCRKCRSHEGKEKRTFERSQV